MGTVIFLSVGSSPDVILLNLAPNNEVIHEGSTLECWTPCGEVYLCGVKTVAGNIIEIENSFFVWRNQILSDYCLPNGSLIINSCYENKTWFMNRYYRGYYNKQITKVMKSFDILDFDLPYRLIQKNG